MTERRALMDGCNYPVTFPVVTHSPPIRGSVTGSGVGHE